EPRKRRGRRGRTKCEKVSEHQRDKYGDDALPHGAPRHKEKLKAPHIIMAEPKSSHSTKVIATADSDGATARDGSARGQAAIDIAGAPARQEPLARLTTRRRRRHAGWRKVCIDVDDGV